jgi:hypothetical protein
MALSEPARVPVAAARVDHLATAAPRSPGKRKPNSVLLAFAISTRP